MFGAPAFPCFISNCKAKFCGRFANVISHVKSEHSKDSRVISVIGQDEINRSNGIKNQIDVNRKVGRENSPDELIIHSNGKYKCKECYREFKDVGNGILREIRYINFLNCYWIALIDQNNNRKHEYVGQSFFTYRFMIKPLAAYLSTFFKEFNRYKNYKRMNDAM